MSSYEQTMLKLEKMASANTAKQMSWQENMSNTSHQREVKDLVAAGLNPVLSSGGSGAQSYTTSVDSAVNGIASMASARESATATRFAASQSAAATRYAAQMNYAAAAYAADQAHDASIYGSDKNLEATQYKTDYGTTVGLATRTVKDLASIVGSYKKTAPDFIKAVSTAAAQIDKKPRLFLDPENQGGSVNSFSDLSNFGQGRVKAFIKSAHIQDTPKNRDLVVRALFQGDENSMRKLYILSASTRNLSTAAAATRYNNW